MAQFDVIEDGIGCIGDLPPAKLKEGKLSDFEVVILYEVVRGIIGKINGTLSMGSGITGHRAGNLDAQYIDTLSPNVANTEWTIPHGLGRVPIGFDVVNRDKAAHAYASSLGSWSDKQLYLKSDGISVTFKLRVY